MYSYELEHQKPDIIVSADGTLHVVNKRLLPEQPAEMYDDCND